MEELTQIWVYLEQSPLLWLTVTVVFYQVADWLYQRSNGLPLCNPVIVAVLLIVALLWLTGTPYGTYFDGAQFVHFLLGPATVALAVPLYQSLDKLRQMAVPVLVALGVGSVVAICSAVWLGQLTGLTTELVASMAPKSITTPIAMGVSEQIGGLPSLTAVLVILTGILGSVAGKELLDLVRIRDAPTQGLALGLASHGIGTARAFQYSAEAGAFAGLAMGLNGALTAVLVPLLVPLLA